jgi:hypothetical protein
MHIRMADRTEQHDVLLAIRPLLAAMPDVMMMQPGSRVTVAALVLIPLGDEPVDDPAVAVPQLAGVQLLSGTTQGFGNRGHLSLTLDSSRYRVSQFVQVELFMSRDGLGKQLAAPATEATQLQP